MPVPDADGERPLRGTLIVAATSFYGTPLFFDFKPWLLAFAGAVGIFALCWVPFIRGLTRSISGITAATERIAQGDFKEHLAEEREDELGKLGVAINRMAGRLAGFVNGQKRFLGDIAHELSAPIARLQFSLGILEHKAEEGQLASLADVQEEVRQMSDLVAELLSFSKAGMAAVQRALSKVDATEAVRKAVEREAGGKGVRIEADGSVFALADEALLIRAVSNVVRNALRYAGEAGPIVVRLEQEAGHVRILVQDWGPGLDPADLDRIFDPFYRPEASRNRETGGTGLGLAIVQSCVAACEGAVKCRNRVPSGLEVEIRLKAAG
jgi:two-component system sensor histidine kinase CpxA